MEDIAASQGWKRVKLDSRLRVMWLFFSARCGGEQIIGEPAGRRELSVRDERGCAKECKEIWKTELRGGVACGSGN